VDGLPPTFDEPIGHIRHWAGATNDVRLANELRVGDPSHLCVPIVVKAREIGVIVTVARTWSSLYSRADQLPYPANRRKLCPVCIEAEQLRRRR
jgi:hypothetical protein